MTNLLKLDFRKLDWHKLDPRNLVPTSRRPGRALLGLALDRGKLEGAAIRRTNGAVEVKNTFSASLSLDPLTDAPELVGREIRKHLDAAGIRERKCTVCLPLGWTLTLPVDLPDLPEADLESFLQIEAERGFPYGPDSLVVSRSLYSTADGARHALLVAIQWDHIARLEAVLLAAQLRPVSFSIGITALQRPDAGSPDCVLALVPGEDNIGLQISCGGGVAVLRTVEDAFESTGAERRLQPDHVTRELRITLGQLPPELAQTVRRVRVFGQTDKARELAEQLAKRLHSQGITVEQVKKLEPGEFGVRIPDGAPVSQAFGLAARYLAGQPAMFEFLPPKVSAWQQFANRYALGKLAPLWAAAGAIVLLVGLAFLAQQLQLVYWQTRWSGMQKRVAELQRMQQQIKKFRPWFDDSFRSLSVLRCLTEAFPEDGAVSARTVEIRDPGHVICTGTARDNASLQRTLDKLRAAKEVAAVHVEQTRGASPLQFTFNFQWGKQTAQ